MHPKSYIETTDRRYFGGKSSKWRWGRVLSWKIPEFCRAEPDPITAIFALLGFPSTIQGTTYRKQFYPKPMVPMENRDSEGVPFAVIRHLADIAPWRVPKSGHVTITKIENLHTDTRINFTDSKKCYSFRSTMKNNEVIAEKPCQNSGVTRRLWTLGRLELTLEVILTSVLFMSVSLPMESRDSKGVPGAL